MIYCVEDDASIRDIEVYTLNSTGFEAAGFADGEAFIAALKKRLPALVILDIMLPGQYDGLALLDYLRKNDATHDIPVIMATAKGMEYDKVHALDIGADDYLVKPFGMMEMVSRVKAVLRRSTAAHVSATNETVLRRDGLTLDTRSHTVSVDKGEVALTYKEFELLKLFMSHPGVAYTRDMLFSEIWGEDFVGETRTVDMHVRTLRQKLCAYGELIETVRGVGYRFRAPDNGSV